MINKFYSKELYGNKNFEHNYLKNIESFYQDIDQFFLIEIPLRFKTLYCVTGNRNTRFPGLGAKVGCFKFFIKLKFKTIMHFLASKLN